MYRKIPAHADLQCNCVHSQGDVGSYGGVTVANSEELLDRDYSNQEHTGVLGGLSRNLIDYPGAKGRSQAFGSFVNLDFCFTNVYLFAPDFTWIDDGQMQQALYEDWNQERYHGAGARSQSLSCVAKT